MKPLVCSMLALALGLTPALASATEKAPTKAVVKGQKTKKETTEGKAGHVVHVKHVTREHAKLEKVSARRGHAAEPKSEAGVSVVPASLSSHVKVQDAKHETKREERSVKASSANVKPGKNAAEKGTKKSTKKKDDADKDGEPTRDEDLAELVARKGGNDGVAPEETDGRSSPEPEATELLDATCFRRPITVTRGAEHERFSLMKCDGTLAPLARERLSIFMRPSQAERPVAPIEELARKPGDELARGIRRVDAGLVTRLSQIIEHFVPPRASARIDVVAGVRPTSVGSKHQTGLAVDFRLDGVKNEEVHAFCKTLTDTGCGLYPTASFVHIDVREPGTGHVTWIDVARPGEAPKYVGEPPASDETRRGSQELKMTSSRRREERSSVDESKPAGSTRKSPSPRVDRETGEKLPSLPAPAR